MNLVVVCGVLVLCCACFWYYHYNRLPSSSNINECVAHLRHKPTRISIVGTSGSGKSTLGKTLGKELGLHFLELDSYFHGPNWTPTPNEIFKGNLFQRLGIDPSSSLLLEDGKVREWIVDGNYGVVRNIVWKNATVILWLDYHYVVVFPRLLFRILKRGIFRTVLWNGNVENMFSHFFSKDSLLLWVWRTHSGRKIEFSKLLFEAPITNAYVIRLISPAHTHLLEMKLKSSKKKHSNKRRK